MSACYNQEKEWIHLELFFIVFNPYFQENKLAFRSDPPAAKINDGEGSGTIGNCLFLKLSVAKRTER